MTQTTTTVSAGIPARMQKSMDSARPLPFPLTCQHRRNMSRRAEVYRSRKRRGSMMQTTTTVSAGMPARMQKSMDWGSDTAPRCRRLLPFRLTSLHRRNMSRRVEVYGLRKRRGSMTQTTTTVSAGIPARMQKNMDWGSDAAPLCRQPLLFLLASSKDATRHEGQISLDQEAQRLHDADTHCHFRGACQQRYDVLR